MNNSSFDAIALASAACALTSTPPTGDDGGLPSERSQEARRIQTGFLQATCNLS